jgi:hypothetical protein
VPAAAHGTNDCPIKAMDATIRTPKKHAVSAQKKSASEDPMTLELERKTLLRVFEQVEKVREIGTKSGESEAVSEG